MSEPGRPSLLSERAKALLIMLAPASVLLIAFIILPFFLAVGFSFTNQSLLPRRVPTQVLGLTNYIGILSDPRFWTAAYNTARFAVVVVPVQSGLALLLAVLVNGSFPGRNVFRGIFFLPTILSMSVVCVVWAGILRAPAGVLNSVVQTMSLGLIGPQDWLGDATLAMPTIIVLSMWQGIGFQMVIYLAGLQSISGQLYEAARIDGANTWQRFWHITFPSLRNTHIFVTLTTTVLAFKLFGQVDVLTQGGPVNATNTLVRYIYMSGFREQRVGYASAAAVIFFLLVLAVAAVQRFLMRETREI